MSGSPESQTREVARGKSREIPPSSTITDPESTGSNDGDNYPVSQPVDSQPEEDVSNVIIKPLSEISAEEKARWRQYSDPKEFFNAPGWDRDSTRALVVECEAATKFSKMKSFSEWLIRARRNIVVSRLKS